MEKDSDPEGDEPEKSGCGSKQDNGDG